jgi:hypothetical protein
VRHVAFGHVYRFSIVKGEYVSRKLIDGPRTENKGAEANLID